MSSNQVLMSTIFFCSLSFISFIFLFIVHQNIFKISKGIVWPSSAFFILLKTFLPIAKRNSFRFSYKFLTFFPSFLYILFFLYSFFQFLIFKIQTVSSIVGYRVILQNDLGTVIRYTRCSIKTGSYREIVIPQTLLSSRNDIGGIRVSKNCFLLTQSKKFFFYFFEIIFYMPVRILLRSFRFIFFGIINLILFCADMWDAVCWE